MLNNFGFGTMGIFENLAPVEHSAPKAQNSSKEKTKRNEAGKKTAVNEPGEKSEKIARYRTPAWIHFDSYPSLEITEAGEFTLEELLAKITTLTGLYLFQQHPQELSIKRTADNSYLLRPTLMTKVEKGDAGCKLLLDSLLNSLPETLEEKSGSTQASKETKEEKVSKDTVWKVKDYIKKTYGLDVDLYLLGDTYIPVPISPSSGSAENLHFPIKVCGLRVPMELIVLGESTISEENYKASGEDENVLSLISKKGIEETIQNLYPEYANDLALGIDEENNAVQIMHKPPLTSSSSSKSEKKEELYPTDAIISLVFTRLQLSANDFGGAKKVTKKEVLRYLGKSYPEYSAERTELLYDKKKNTIMPILKSGKRGAYSLEDTADYRHESSDLMDIFASKSSGANDLGCVLGNVQLNLPKIPFSLLKEVIDLFWDTFVVYHSEAIALLYYRRSTSCYQLFVPEQTVSRDSVAFQRKFELECNPDLIPAMEIHSHGSYPAFWSSVDNQDEVSHKLYAVVGNFPNFSYDENHILVRAATGVYHVQCSLWDIFESPSSIQDLNSKLSHIRIAGLKEEPETRAEW